MVVRGDSLAARMSQYLIDQISATPNIDVRTTTQIAAAAGTGKLETLTLKHTRTGSTQTIPASALVVLIGAVPHTAWLPPQISRDEHGFILTGSDLPTTATPHPGGPCPARHSRWRPACPASSPPAMSATAQSNASPPQSAKAPSPPPR